MGKTQSISNRQLKKLDDKTNFFFENHTVIEDFPEGIADLRKEDIPVQQCFKRSDFRYQNALTIDSADSKDMDDAVYVAKTFNGYFVAVHIADVAYHVPFRSVLDDIACNRASSIYLPDRVVPMLPKILSNDLCSLNPGVDRYTLSVLINLDDFGNVLSSKVEKGIIRSRVKGIYSEVNCLLEGKKDKKLMYKYSSVYQELRVMKSLYKILRERRIRTGATVEDSNKPKITFGDNGIELTPTKDGVSENMIEELMILANSAVADYLCDHNLPAIFRVQDEKNYMAAYLPVRSHHAELALESYSHFTSPIRRYGDLVIHQIISMYLNNISSAEIKRKFEEPLPEICDRITRRSRTIKDIQNNCERFCYGLYFQAHPQEQHFGKIINFNDSGKPIIHMDEYNINVIGEPIGNMKLGDRFAFTVRFSETNNRLFAHNLLRLAA